MTVFLRFANLESFLHHHLRTYLHVTQVPAIESLFPDTYARKFLKNIC